MMDRYLPAKDLPPDLKSLPREETVCQFCGVSYLVHHEMKTLESIITDLRGQLQRRVISHLESEKVRWDQEKGKLEDCVQCLENDLANAKSMKTALEMEKAIWDQERQKLLLSIKTLENNSSIMSEKYIDELRRAKEALSRKEEELSNVTLSAREKEACCSLKLTAACSLLGQMKYLSDRTRTDLTGMLAYLFACIGKIMQICSEFDAKVSSRVRSRVADFQREFAAEKAKYISACKNWAQARDDLQQQATNAEKQRKDLATELLAIQEAKKVCNSELTKYKDMCSTMSKRVRDLESELSRVQVDSTERMSRQQIAIGEIQGKLSFTEKALTDTNEKLLSLKESYTKETEGKQSMQRLLEEARMQLSSTGLQLKQLSLSHDQQMQKIHEKHTDELRKVKESYEKQSKAVLAQSRSGQELYNKQISDLQSTVEKQHTTIQLLRDDIRKEKAVFDAEVTRHLHEVKDLEMRLKEEQVSAQTALQSMSAALHGVKNQLEVKMKLCSDLESKLTSCYKEISHLQTTVQMGCEERHTLEKGLEESRAALKKLSYHEKLQHK
ncbi:hypothetical protein EMCRGX_G023206 [Ephydatia muelleri]